MALKKSNIDCLVTLAGIFTTIFFSCQNIKKAAIRDFKLAIPKKIEIIDNIASGFEFYC